jgi:hypothetical protein
MKNLVSLIVVIVLLGPLAVVSDTIYQWTDEQGVLRFSNDPPPENVENFEKVESGTSPDIPALPGDERRSSYDQMVERSSEEAQRLEQQRRIEAEAQAADKLRRAQAEREKVIAAQRSRLEKEIEELNKRALGPTYTQGMKQAQIDKLLKQIEQLESNPDAVNP